MEVEVVHAWEREGTMSSGSWGMSVAVPEPSRSLMSLRTSLMLVVATVVEVLL